MGVPKPLVQVAGEPLVVQLLATLAALGCETLTCMVRAEFPEVVRVLHGRRFGPPLEVRSCLTPSSLHTLVAGLETIRPGPVFCTMVDTVMPPSDWRLVYGSAETALEGGSDAVLAVTPFVDDESPLYARISADGLVLGLGDDPVVPPCVTGGVYGLSPAARTAAREALAAGVQRMRRFLSWLVARGGRVAAVSVPRIIDIDHEADLHLANAWLASPEGQG